MEWARFHADVTVQPFEELDSTAIKDLDHQAERIAELRGVPGADVTLDATQ